MAQLKLEQITAAVAVYLANNITSSTTIVHPGMAVDVQGSAGPTDWMEWWIEGTERIPHRRHASDLEQRWVNIHFMIFTLKTTSRYRYLDILKDLTDQLTHAEIAIANFDVSSGATVGHLSVREPETTDMTMELNNTTRSSAAAMEVVFPAEAQET